MEEVANKEVPKLVGTTKRPKGLHQEVDLTETITTFISKSLYLKRTNVIFVDRSSQI